jgi:hypothetical protein
LTPPQVQVSAPWALCILAVGDYRSWDLQGTGMIEYLHKKQRKMFMNVGRTIFILCKQKMLELNIKLKSCFYYSMVTVVLFFNFHANDELVTFTFLLKVEIMQDDLPTICRSRKG